MTRDSETNEYGSHLLPTFTWDEKRKNEDPRTGDQIFDISIINNEDNAILLTKTGFQAVRAWSALKGLPVTGKVKIDDSYTLEVKEFNPPKDSFLKLKEQVHLKSRAVYRFKIRLKNYAQNGNESEIKISLIINGQICRSNKIYLGLF